MRDAHKPPNCIVDHEVVLTQEKSQEESLRQTSEHARRADCHGGQKLEAWHYSDAADRDLPDLSTLTA
jgi:hypothetical protein